MDVRIVKVLQFASHVNLVIILIHQINVKHVRPVCLVVGYVFLTLSVQGVEIITIKVEINVSSAMIHIAKCVHLHLAIDAFQVSI